MRKAIQVLGARFSMTPVLFAFSGRGHEDEQGRKKFVHVEVPGHVVGAAEKPNFHEQEMRRLRWVPMVAMGYGNPADDHIRDFHVYHDTEGTTTLHKNQELDRLAQARQDTLASNSPGHEHFMDHVRHYEDVIRQAHEAAKRKGQIFQQIHLHPEYEPFFRAMRDAFREHNESGHHGVADPVDQAPSLIASDWYDEQYHPGLAELVRLHHKAYGHADPASHLGWADMSDDERERLIDEHNSLHGRSRHSITQVLGARMSLSPVLFAFATDAEREKLARHLGGLRYTEPLPRIKKADVEPPRPEVAPQAKPTAVETKPARDPNQPFLPGIEPEVPPPPENASEEERFLHLMNSGRPHGHEPFTPEEVKEFLSKRRKAAPAESRRARDMAELKGLGELLRGKEIDPHQVEYPKRPPGYVPNVYERRQKMLDLAAQGKMPRHIANILGLDEKTVTAYLAEPMKEHLSLTDEGQEEENHPLRVHYGDDRHYDDWNDGGAVRYHRGRSVENADRIRAGIDKSRDMAARAKETGKIQAAYQGVSHPSRQGGYDILIADPAGRVTLHHRTEVAGHSPFLYAQSLAKDVDTRHPDAGNAENLLDSIDGSRLAAEAWHKHALDRGNVFAIFGRQPEQLSLGVVPVVRETLLGWSSDA